MAVVTDILETVLALRGAAQYVAGMGQVTRATQAQAVAQAGLTGVGGAAGAAGGGLAGGFGAAALLGSVANLAKVVLIAQTVHRAFTTFKSDEKIMRDFALTMRNLGRSADIEPIIAQAQELSRATGEDDERIVNLAKTLAAFGVSTNDIQRGLEPILNLAEQFNRTPEEVAQAFGRANQGVTRGLRQFGIHIKEGTRGVVALHEALAIAELKAKGLARANLDTVGGSFKNLQTQFDNMLSAATRLFGPALINTFNFLAKSLEGWTLLFERIADALGIRKPEDISNVPGGSSVKGDPEQTALLGEIATNTGPAGPLVKQVLGGRGEIARRAFTWRDARMSFGV